MATIRTTTVADAHAIAVVHVESWRAAYRGLLPRDVLDGLSVDRRAAFWRDNIGTRDGHTLVAVDEPSGRVRGFVNVGPSRDPETAGAGSVGELRAIYLLPDAWGSGTGRRLHDAALELLHPDFAEVTLWVLDTNARARAFYEHMGWYDDGVTKNDDRGGVVLSEIRYRRALP
jgi:GNAT superfamily N-acetyltransferase